MLCRVNSGLSKGIPSATVQLPPSDIYFKKQFQGQSKIRASLTTEHVIRASIAGLWSTSCSCLHCRLCHSEMVSNSWCECSWHICTHVKTVHSTYSTQHIEWWAHSHSDSWEGQHYKLWTLDLLSHKFKPAVMITWLVKQKVKAQPVSSNWSQVLLKQSKKTKRWREIIMRKINKLYIIANKHSDWYYDGHKRRQINFIGQQSQEANVSVSFSTVISRSM